MILTSVVLATFAAVTLWWTMHAWRTPETLAATRFAEPDGDHRLTFSLLLPARHEQAVLEQGALTKDEILLAWELDEEGYSEVRRRLIARVHFVAGSQRVGGFRAKDQRGRLPEEGADTILREQWEDQVVGRLAQLFQHKELEDLLSYLAYTVRQSRVTRAEADRRGTKVELARILKESGYINDYKISKEGAKSTLTIAMRYGPEGERVISGIERVSRSGRRVYVNKNEIPQILGGLGITIISTPQGMMTGGESRRRGLGGEVICNVW